MKRILNRPATSKSFYMLEKLNRRIRLRKTRVIDLTTKHSIDQPLQKWEWPKGTWLQNRMKSMRNMKDSSSTRRSRRAMWTDTEQAAAEKLALCDFGIDPKTWE
jgi:hypothetical protein